MNGLRCHFGWETGNGCRLPYDHSGPHRTSALYHAPIPVEASRAEEPSDTERLDWLEQQFSGRWGANALPVSSAVHLTWYPEGWHVAADEFSEPVIDGASFRAAIDAAMRPSPTTTTPEEPK